MLVVGRQGCAAAEAAAASLGPLPVLKVCMGYPQVRWPSACIVRFNHALSSI